ncbi:hypothetical protein ACTXT7_001715 [Hymenolepis weldensis]
MKPLSKLCRSYKQQRRLYQISGELINRDIYFGSPRQQITFHIKDEIMNPANQDFRVTADGRVLVARETLDRETTNTYLFTVVATDSGKPSLSATAQVSQNASSSWQFNAKQVFQKWNRVICYTTCRNCDNIISDCYEIKCLRCNRFVPA